MNPTCSAARPDSRGFIRVGVLILAGMLTFLAVCALGIIGMFRLGSEATTLRQTVMNSVPGVWEKKIALRVGGIATGLVRLGSGFFKLEPEPRAALATIHGAEVGVYALRDEPGLVNVSAILARMDKAMSRRGWDRGVGVGKEHELVAVYFPRQGLSPRRAKCCVVVFQGRDLVVVSARGNLEPLFQLASGRLDRELGRAANHLDLCHASIGFAPDPSSAR